jgi:hypothetical protein
MTIRELVEELNQFVEADDRKLRVPSETIPVDLQAASFVKRMRQRLDALEKRVTDAAIRYFARAGK